MKFYDRIKEIKQLRNIEAASNDSSRFTVVSGRRRVGKTTLIREAYKDTPFLYFFVGRKAESELCRTFAGIAEETLGIPFGSYEHFGDLFRAIMMIAKKQHVTMVIDEFQEFYRVNPSVYSDMQNYWDEYHTEAKMNLVVCGSVNSLLNKIFKDKKEPLFGRQTDMIKVKPFTPSVLKEIIGDLNPQYSKEDLLSLYLITGGVAKYVQLLSRQVLSHANMFDVVFEDESTFLTEGKTILIEEFGKDYGKYFSILSLIAQGHNTRGEIEDILHFEVGGYLTKLIEDYEIIVKHQPLFEKSANKNVRYVIEDKFLRFWFRYIHKYDYIIEAGGKDKLKQIVLKEYKTYSGLVLEDFFRDSMRESGEYTRIGYWHDRKGENEIDIIAEDELSKKLEIIEVKRQESNIDYSILRSKADVFLKTIKHDFSKYDIKYKGFSLLEM